MNKLTIIIVFVLGLSCIMHSQTVDRIGVYAGVTHSNLDFRIGPEGDLSSVDFIPITTSNLGVWIDLLQHDFVQITGNVGLNNKGGFNNTEYTDVDGNIKEVSDELRTIEYKYVTINLGAKIRFPIENFIVYGNLGPRFDVFVLEDSEPDYTGVNSVHMNRNNYGLFAGLGVEYPFNDTWSIDARVIENINFTPMFDVGSVGESPAVVIKDTTRSLQVGLSYKFQERTQKNDRDPVRYP